MVNLMPSFSATKSSSDLCN